MTFLGMPLLPSKRRSDLPAGQGNIIEAEAFPEASHEHLSNQQLRNNIGHATSSIRSKRAEVVSELDDWEALRDAGEATKNEVMANLPEYLEQFEAAFTAAGGIIHWARDADEANAIVTELVEDNAPVLDNGRREVIKVKSMATQESAQRTPRDRGHRCVRDGPGRTHRPARRGQTQPYPRSCHPPQPG